jgi:hypothetical protein
MEPLLGGMLVNPPRSIQELWDTATKRRTPADWGLQWLWNQPEVSVVLSGMNTMQQVKENVASADASGIGMLTEEELALVDRVCEKYQELGPIPCTGCGYCEPCPNGVDIPYNFKLYNEGVMYDKPDEARVWYRLLMLSHKESFYARGQAANCIQCLECEDKCPQNIPISEWMDTVHQVLGEGRPF